MSFKLSIPGYTYGDIISQKHTCDGQDLSPKIVWSEPPASTKSFALILEDPDAPRGTFTHWVLYNIPPDTKELPEGIKNGEGKVGNFFQGANDFGKIGYNGPCPPGKAVHRYFFYLYALVEKPDLGPNMKASDIKKLLDSKLIKQASYMLRYGRHYEQSK